MVPVLLRSATAGHAMWGLDQSIVPFSASREKPLTCLTHSFKLCYLRQLVPACPGYLHLAPICEWGPMPRRILHGTL